MRTFVGTVKGFAPGQLTIEIPCGARKTLRCGEETRRQGLSLLGRRVRFQAFLDEGTESLASPLFVIGSSFGLKAIRDEAELEPEPRAPGKTSGIRETEAGLYARGLARDFK